MPHLQAGMPHLHAGVPQGASKGLGSRGLISPEALQALATQPAVMSCNGHIKVSQGKVYFRYGGFWHVYYRLHRFLQTVKMVQVRAGIPLSSIIPICQSQE